MPNLIGIGNSQAPTNAMLGRFAFQDSIGEINIDKIKAETSDTATDIFVYDTRKDSDGGAWRHRTQNTSWYNESASATRGARKEFPAVAVIVAEQNFITIYDGDDPNLPMWMVFNTLSPTGTSQGMGNPSQSGRPMIQIQNVDKVVHMLNGILVTGTKNEGSNYGQPVINFINEKVLRMDSQGGEGGEWVGNIAQRNEALGYRHVTHDYVIKASHVNDVAMTVLPNAPIDETTGLPIPTIAVATPDGVSVVKDDGSVVDIKGTHGGGDNDTQFVDFDSKTNAVISGFDYGGGNTNSIYKLHVFPIPSTDITENTFYNGYQNHHRRVQTGSNITIPKLEGNYLYDAISAGGNGRYAIRTGHSPSTGYAAALNIMQEEPGTDGSNTNFPSNSRIAYIAKDYNTGWMHGDIKGAFLSSTDDTDLDRTNLLTVGTFDSASGWSLSGTGAFSISGGKLNGNGTSGVSFAQRAETPAVITSGLTYTVKAVVTHTSGNLYVRVANCSYSVNIGSTGTHYISLRAGNVPTETVLFYSDGFNGTIDDVEVYIEDQDRSHSKKGLQVYGTITKTPVATGAELVAYSGSSTSNYLQQSYNSDLNFGANADFCVMGWLNTPSVGGGQYIFDRSVTYNSSRDFQIWIAADLRYLTIYVAGSQVATTGNNRYPNNEWFQYCVLRKDDRCIIYINGEEVVNNSSTVSTIASSNVPTKILYNMNSNTKSALMRISASAPTPEQVRKIYNDEKCLFHENAKCTLYGTSNDIKAIAYDDTNDILHAGTSSGRSEFQGLTRINNTTTAVTTAISASNGLVAEQ